MSNVFKTKGSGIIEFRSIPLCYHRCQLKQVLLCVCSFAQSFLVLWDPMDCSPPGFPVHGIFQARILEWVAISSSRRSSQPRDQTHISCIPCTSRRMLYHWATWRVSSKYQTSPKPQWRTELACCSPWGGKHQTWLSSWTTTKPHLSKSAEIKFINV